VEASVGFDKGRTDLDAYTSRAYDQLDSFEDGRDRTVTFRLLADQTVGRRGDLRAAFTLSDIRHDETIPDGRFEYQQRLWSGGLENEWQLVQAAGALQSLALSVGGAYDVGETPKTGGREALGQVSEWGGRVGLSAVVGRGRTVLHAGLSRRGRFPALRELYSGAVNRFAPNPELQPENLVTAETGVTTRVGGGEVQAVVFHNRLDDAVVRTTLEDGRFMRVNRNELRSTGLELVGSHGLGPVDLAANLTLQDVELRDPGAEVTHRPENLPEVFGEVNARFPLPGGFVGGAGVEYTGDQFSIDPATGEDTELDASAVVGAHLSRTWPVAVSWGGGTWGRLEARLAVDNIGDTRLYDAAGLPEPGRRVRFEVRVR
jgi:iron complex outermembrane receptor protein